MINNIIRVGQNYYDALVINLYIIVLISHYVYTIECILVITTSVHVPDIPCRLIIRVVPFSQQQIENRSRPKVLCETA